MNYIFFYFSEAGLYKEALQLLESVESEANSQSVTLLGIVHFHMGNFEDAAGMFEVAFELIPKEDSSGRFAVDVALALTMALDGRDGEAAEKISAM